MQLTPSKVFSALYYKIDGLIHAFDIPSSCLTSSVSCLALLSSIICKIYLLHLYISTQGRPKVGYIIDSSPFILGLRDPSPAQNILVMCDVTAGSMAGSTIDTASLFWPSLFLCCSGQQLGDGGRRSLTIMAGWVFLSGLWYDVHEWYDVHVPS